MSALEPLMGMTRRAMLRVLAGTIAAFALVGPARATESGQGNNAGGGNNNAGGNGQGSGGGSGGGNSNAGGNGQSSSGNAGGKKSGGVSAGGNPQNSSSPARRKEDHDRVLEAVEQGRARPLRDLLPEIEVKYRADVIDVTLRERSGTLFYQIKMLSQEGRIFVVSVDAATGLAQPLGS